MNAHEYAKLPVCQSCGMPMQSPDQYGRHAVGTPHTEYCVYCCPEGEEKMTGTLEEMIALCAPIEVKLGPHPDLETARARLSQYLPTLKRWKTNG